MDVKAAQPAASPFGEDETEESPRGNPEGFWDTE
jgi:hypothetical protein